LRSPSLLVWGAQESSRLRSRTLRRQLTPSSSVLYGKTDAIDLKATKLPTTNWPIGALHTRPQMLSGAGLRYLAAKMFEDRRLRRPQLTWRSRSAASFKMPLMYVSRTETSCTRRSVGI
jgi:hypothetical protein